VTPGTPARRAWAAPAIVFFALAANLPALFPGFLQDDHPIVENNPLLDGLAGLPRLVSRAYWAVGDRPLPDLWRPVTMLSFALNRAVGGAGAFGYRLVNLMLHAGLALLLLALGRRLFAGRPGLSTGTSSATLLDPAAAAALLFAVHAVHTEVLGFVVGRAELLAAAGALLCVLLFLRGRDRQAGGAAWFALSIACFALGFLAKENAVAAPVLALLSDLLIVRRRPAWRFHAASGATLAILLAARRLVIGRIGSEGLVHFVDNPITHMPFAAGRRAAIEVLGRYAGLLVAPLRLSVDYSYDAIPAPTGWLDPGFLLGAAAVAACAAGLALAWRRRPEIAFALAWLGAALLPVANVVFPIGTIMAERLLYLPSAGFCLLLAAAYGVLLEGPPAATRWRARLAPVAVALLVLLLGARSQVRLRDWRDDYTLFKSALAVAPRSVKVQFNFGSACEERGEDAAAATAYEKALAIWPEFADAHYNLAGVLARRRDWPAAVAHYRAALGAQPANVKYLVNLAHALNGTGQPEEARELLRRAVGLDPSSDQAYTTLGAAELLRGDARAAERAYAEAVRLVPGNPGYWTNLGLARERMGEPAGAVEAYRRASALAPGDPVTRNRLGVVLEAAGRPQEAAAEYRAASALAPGVPIPLRNLGLLLFRLGDRPAALRALEQAASLDPRGEVMDAEARRILDALRRSERGPS
jgi:tetratricopeptide (TPR) repeat protein